MARSTGERDKERNKGLQRSDSFATSKRALENTECAAEPSLGTLTIDSIESSRSIKDAESDFFGALDTPHTAPSPQIHTHTLSHSQGQGVSPSRTASSSSPSAFGFDRAESLSDLHGIKSPSLAISTLPYYGNRSPPYFSPASITASTSTPANPGTAPFRLHTPTNGYSNSYSNSNGINANGSINSSGADTATGTGIAMSPSGVAHSDTGKVAVYESPFSRPASAFSPSATSSSLHVYNPSPSHRLSINQGQGLGQGQGQGQERESPRMHTERILTGLGLKSSSADKTIAARELRHLVRTADDTYWTEYCPQV